MGASLKTNQMSGGRRGRKRRHAPIAVSELVAKIKAMAKNGLEENILFRGDRNVGYGRVAEVMGAVHDGGFTKFKFVYGPEEIAKGPPPRPK